MPITLNLGSTTSRQNKGSKIVPSINFAKPIQRPERVKIYLRCKVPENGAVDEFKELSFVDNGGEKELNFLENERKKENGGEIPSFRHPVSASEFRKIMHQLIDFVCDYFEEQAEQLPVKSQVKMREIICKLPTHAPKRKENWSQVWKDFEDIIMPGLMQWQSPNFFGYFPVTSSYPAIMGDFLSAALGQLPLLHQTSPAATELEIVVMDWLARMMQLPDKFLCGRGGGVGGGVIQGSSSEAIIVALLAAKFKKLKGLNSEEQNKLVVYSSDQAHSSLQKGCRVLGFLNLRLLPTSKKNDWALDPETFKKAVEEDLAKGLIPCMLQINVGTTSTTAVDPIYELTKISSSYGIWSHVDAAYAGSAAICPEIRLRYFYRLEKVDSLSINIHKWMLTSFDFCALWIGDSENLKASLALTPAYLETKDDSMDFKDWTIGLSRRFRALKVWFLLRLYGVEEVQAKIRHDIELATWFANKIDEDPIFQLMAPQRFGLVCFKVSGQSNAFNKHFLDNLNDSGKLFMVHTVVGGELMLRMAIGGVHTRFQHVEAAWKLIRQTAVQMLADPHILHEISK